MPIMTKTDIAGLTLELWGDDQGAELLRRRAIVPMLEGRPSKDVANCITGAVLSYPHYNLDALAVVHGPLSRISAYDIRRPDQPPVPYNVVEQDGGGRVYVPFNRKHPTGEVAASVNLLSDGSYSTFFSSTTSFASSALSSATAVTSWLSNLDTNKSYIELPGKLYIPINTYEEDNTYITELTAKGYSVSTEIIMKRYASILSSHSPAETQKLLNRFAIEAVRIGGNPDLLAQVAVGRGLKQRDAEKTVQSAIRKLKRDPAGVPTILEKAEAWREHWLGEFRPRYAPLLDFVLSEAVRVNNMRPAINQSSNPTGLNQKAVSYMLDEMCKTGALNKHVQEGRQPNGKKHVNQYHLKIQGEEL